MEKIDVCKKLIRLGWTSRAVIDNRRTREVTASAFPMLFGLQMNSFIHEIIMDRLSWGSCEHVWSSYYEQYRNMGARIKDIE